MPASTTPRGAPRSPASARRIARLVTTALTLGWTLFWAAAAAPALRAQTALGSGAWRPGVEAHEVFEALFVASHWGIRWLPGVLALLAAGYLVDRRLRRVGA